MNKRWLKLAVVPVALSLVAAACGSDDDSSGSDTSDAVTEATEATEGTDASGGETTDFEGAEVTITGSERDDPSVIAINDALNEFGPMNLKVTFAGDADWEANINTQVQGGNPPDIGLFPQPGKLADFAAKASSCPSTTQSTLPSPSTGHRVFRCRQGRRRAVRRTGEVRPQGHRLLQAGTIRSRRLRSSHDVRRVRRTGRRDGCGRWSKPLCVGIESGTATGWMFTDWVEDMMLRLWGGDVYDQWVTNEVKFDDPRVVEAMQAVKDLWTDENVFAAGGTISATNFGLRCRGTRQRRLLHGPSLELLRRSVPGRYAPSPTRRTRTAIDVFYFPDINGDGPVLSAGNFAAAFNDDPATMAVLEYMARRLRPEPSAHPVSRTRRQPLGLPVGCQGAGPERLPAARAAVPGDPDQRRLRALRRWRPDAGRCRLGLVLVGGHVPRQR